VIRTPRTELRRLPERGSHETSVIHAVLDAGSIAYVGFVADGQAVVIPMIYGRDGNTLLLHGSASSRMLAALDTGMPACANVMVLDGLVLARSAFHHSVNYRSVVAFGTARAISQPAHKIRALRTISEHMLPGRWAEVRGPTKAELAATSVLEFSMDEASAKTRAGPPHDDEANYARSVWAGVLPLSLQRGAPLPDPRLAGGIDLPACLRRTRPDR
jgi:nitroimidazol reductase NimA-like FMN-containing flavoprotein (pyridoxamine 5'-phosphate oxidase superfamily)